MDLPAGTYSDDTQLRLAVSRCIRASGRFDAEAFSKVELPVFLSYELGAGIGTKTAAQALGRRSTRWNSNFFDTKRSRYLNGGGNGAAMRIQPHVWVSRDFRPDHYLPNVLRDALITHGHPRGILGAALHALALGSTLREGSVPEPSRWGGMLRYLSRVPDLMSADEALTERWVPLWERSAKRSWRDAVEETLVEMSRDVDAVTATLFEEIPRHGDDRYAEVADRIGALRRETRGSGAMSAVLSLWLAWTYRAEPEEGLRVAANLIGSDTDTIATLAGALLGAVAKLDLPGPLLDRDLHEREASRLERLRMGEPVEDFPHPDVLHWQPPPTLSDAVGLINDRPALAGLGFVKEIGPLHPARGKDDGGWQWLLLSHGQHALTKRRNELPELPPSARPRRRNTAPPSRPQGPGDQISLAGAEATTNAGGRATEFPSEVEEGIALVARSNFEQLLVGRLLFHYAVQPYGSTKAALFAAGVASRLREREGSERANQANGRAEPPGVLPDDAPPARTRTQ